MWGAIAKVLPASALSALRRGMPGYLAGQATFRSDGCSFWPDANHAGCCREHDAAYWDGGPASARAEADGRLRACVAERLAGAVEDRLNRTVHAVARRVGAGYGAVVWLGVRVGGHPWWPLPWRWGYRHAWPASAAPRLPPSPRLRRTGRRDEPARREAAGG